MAEAPRRALLLLCCPKPISSEHGPTSGAQSGRLHHILQCAVPAQNEHIQIQSPAAMGLRPWWSPNASASEMWQVWLVAFHSVLSIPRIPSLARTPQRRRCRTEEHHPAPTHVQYIRARASAACPPVPTKTLETPPGLIRQCQPHQYFLPAWGFSLLSPHLFRLPPHPPHPSTQSVSTFPRLSLCFCLSSSSSSQSAVLHPLSLLLLGSPLPSPHPSHPHHPSLAPPLHPPSIPPMVPCTGPCRGSHTHAHSAGRRNSRRRRCPASCRPGRTRCFINLSLPPRPLASELLFHPQFLPQTPFNANLEIIQRSRRL